MRRRQVCRSFGRGNRPGYATSGDWIPSQSWPGRTPLLGSTVEHAPHHALCRVLVPWPPKSKAQASGGKRREGGKNLPQMICRSPEGFTQPLRWNRITIGEMIEVQRLNLVTGRFKRLLGLAAGWSLVVLGVLGIFLPILPGLPFLLLGITILSAEYAWARKLLQKLRDRFPSLTSRSESAKARAGAWVRRIVPTGSDDSRR